MPSPSEIAGQLGEMAAALAWLAISWHLVAIAAAAALLGGWRPSARAGLWLLALPALSVAISAAAHANPFNAVSFGALFTALVALGAASGHRASEGGPRWAAALGAALAGFTLLAGGFGSRAAAALVAAWCAFYALFGVFRLGVVIDAGLFAAAAGLLALTARRRGGAAATAPRRRRSPLATAG